MINGTPLCAITIPQLDSVNKSFVEGDKCREEKDSLVSQINNYEALVKGQEKEIKSQAKEVEIQKKISAEKDVIIEESDKIHKRMHRQIKWLKLQRFAFATLCVITTTLYITKK